MIINPFAQVSWDDVPPINKDELDALVQNFSTPTAGLGGQSPLAIALSPMGAAPVTMPTVILARLLRTLQLAHLEEGNITPSRIDFSRFTGEAYLEETPETRIIRERMAQEEQNRSDRSSAEVAQEVDQDLKE